MRVQSNSSFLFSLTVEGAVTGAGTATTEAVVGGSTVGEAEIAEATTAATKAGSITNSTRPIFVDLLPRYVQPTHELYFKFNQRNMSVIEITKKMLWLCIDVT